MAQTEIELTITSGLQEWETANGSKRRVVVTRLGLEKIDVTGDPSSMLGFRQGWCRQCESRAGLPEEIEQGQFGEQVESMKCVPTGRRVANLYCAQPSKGKW